MQYKKQKRTNKQKGKEVIEEDTWYQLKTPALRCVLDTHKHAHTESQYMALFLYVQVYFVGNVILPMSAPRFNDCSFMEGFEIGKFGSYSLHCSPCLSVFLSFFLSVMGAFPLFHNKNLLYTKKGGGAEEEEIGEFDLSNVTVLSQYYFSYSLKFLIN